MPRRTDAGISIETSEYEPYGKLLNRANDDRAGYTGHVMDSATGLTYMQQRYCDPMIGHCLSVDPVTAYDNGDMRFFNRYAYAGNNPYKYTDPDGRAFGIDDGVGFVVGGLIGVAAHAYVSLATNQEMMKGSVAGAFVSGGIAGVGIVNAPETGGLSILAAGALNGAVSASTGNVVKQGVDIASGTQKEFSGKSLAVDTVVGAATGGVVQKFVGVAKVPGLSSGRGNAKAVAQGVATRIANGNAQRMSPKVAFWGAVGRQTGDMHRKGAEMVADGAKAKICDAKKSACE